MNEALPLEAFLAAVADEFDLDLRGYKQSTLERRINKRLFAVNVRDYSEYLTYLRANPEEKAQLLDTMLINVTEFFRDPQAWDAIGREILPYLFRTKRPGDSLRIWVPGCATGEEVYSVAICVAEHLGSHLPEYDVKIYATDVDEDALNVARRGEYSRDKLRRMRPELRERYFQGVQNLRVMRELRRLVIFGRSDIMRDAPISHVDMVVCRNLLIYFDAIAQKHILGRLHYALEEGGILFLGKSESKLTGSPLFSQVNTRWRLFRKTQTNGEHVPVFVVEDTVSQPKEPVSTELSLLRTYHRNILEVLEPALLMLDNHNVVVSHNESALRLWAVKGTLLDQDLARTEIGARFPELLQRLHATAISGSGTQFRCKVEKPDGNTTLQVTVRPVFAENQSHIGTLVYAEDVTHQERLSQTVQQLETTGEELQSANEELETTNEELQSTNEELETTNEELQSTNEELETTNEELQSLNEELENMNEELEFRSRELDALNARYANTLEYMPSPVLLVDAHGKVQFWNSAAQTLFDLPATSVLGLELGQLPLAAPVRQAFIRKMKAAVIKGARAVLRDQDVRLGKRQQRMSVTFTPLGKDPNAQALLVMFSAGGTPEPTSPNPPSKKKATKAAAKKKNAKNAKKKTISKKKKP